MRTRADWADEAAALAARNLMAVGLHERFMRTMAAVHSDMTSGLMQRGSSWPWPWPLPNIEKKKSSDDESDNAPLSLPLRFLPLKWK